MTSFKEIIQLAGTKTVLGFIAGASIGAILTILFSPDKGVDTRRKIAESTVDLGNAIKDGVVDFVKGGKKAAASVNGDLAEGVKMNFNTMG